MNFSDDEDCSLHSNEDYDDYTHGLSKIQLTEDDFEDQTDLVIQCTIDDIIKQIKTNVHNKQILIQDRQNQYLHEPREDASQHEVYICLPRDPPNDVTALLSHLIRSLKLSIPTP